MNTSVTMLVALEEIADANTNALSLLLFLNDFTAIILVLCPIQKNKILVYLACGTCKMFVVVSTSLNGLHHQPKALQVIVYTSVLVSQMGRGAGINDGCNGRPH